MPSEEDSSVEELVGLAWKLDTAISLRRRERALTVADQLLEALVHHDAAMESIRRQLDGDAAAAMRNASRTLLADVALLLQRLRRGPVRVPVQFRDRTVQLVVDEAVFSAGLASPSGVD
jgi:hypothetical protein